MSFVLFHDATLCDINLGIFHIQASRGQLFKTNDVVS